jgi:exodeoxyribonuclease V beta subunit
MGFNDLLTRLDAALRPQRRAPGRAIRSQFPVALIDEFQDTDAIQYRIFDAIYRVAANDAASAGPHRRPQAGHLRLPRRRHLHLPGRPRRRRAAVHPGRNFRSTHAMVGPPTAASSWPKRGRGQGAFLFRSGPGNPVPFLPADANGRKDALQAAGAARRP